MGTAPFKYSVTICSRELPRSSPILLRGPLAEQIELAKEIGYDGIELQLCNPEELDIPSLIHSCERTGLEVSAVATGLEYSINGLSLIDDDPEVRRRMIETLKRHIEVAEAVKSQVIIGCVRGNIPPNGDAGTYWRRFHEGMCELSEYAASRKVDLVLEAINSYVNNFLNTVAETAAYLKYLGRPNVKLHIDTHHINIEDADILEAVRQSAGYLGYVHFAGPNRWYPSQGRIPYGEIQEELHRMGYEGFISLECVPVPDSYTAAYQGLRYLKSI